MQLRSLLYFILTILCLSPIYAEINIPANIDFTGFDGSGFDNPPNAGQLNFNDWNFTGFSDEYAVTGTETTDYNRGTTTGGVTTAGTYAYDDGSNQALWIQPTGGEFTPGTVHLTVCNNTSAIIANLSITYDLLVWNDHDRANSFNFAYSTDDTNFTAVSDLNYTSPEAGDDPVTLQTIAQSTTLPNINLADGACITLQWSSDDVSGSGNRDEFGLDNINVASVAAPACGVANLTLVSDTCDSKTAGTGNDTYTVTISYTGTDANATLTNTGNSGTLTHGGTAGDLDGTNLVISGIAEDDNWSIALTGDCSDVTLSGNAPDCEPPAIVDNMVISEIMYNTTGIDDEWIELCNPTDAVIDMGNWQLTYGSRPDTLTFQANTSVDPGTCVTVALGSNGDGIFNNDCPFTPDFTAVVISDEDNDNLGNTSGTIRLLDDMDNEIDIVMYDDSDGADGDGPSLEVTDLTMDNGATNSNWMESMNAGGSPGVANGSGCPTVATCTITNVTATMLTCNGTSSEFDVNFTHINTSGSFEVINTQDDSVLATGTDSPIMVSIPNTTGETITITVRDGNDNTCEAMATAIMLADCGAIVANQLVFSNLTVGCIETGTNFSITVCATDGTDIQTDYNTDISVSLSTGAGNLAGTLTETPTDGCATFTLSYDAGETIELTASSGTLNGGTPPYTSGDIVITTAGNCPTATITTTAHVFSSEDNAQDLADALNDDWEAGQAASCNAGQNFRTIYGTIDFDETTYVGSITGLTQTDGNNYTGTASFVLVNMDGPLLGTPITSGQFSLSTDDMNMQDSSPKPTSIANTSHFSENFGSPASLNGLLISFDPPITDIGLFLGDVESNPLGTLAQIKAYNNGALLDSVSIAPTTADPNDCGDGGNGGAGSNNNDFEGCGNEGTNWISVSGDPMTDLLIIVGDDDIGDSGFTEHLSFGGVTLGGACDDTGVVCPDIVDGSLAGSATDICSGDSVSVCVDYQLNGREYTAYPVSFSYDDGATWFEGIYDVDSMTVCYTFKDDEALTSDNTCDNTFYPFIAEITALTDDCVPDRQEGSNSDIISVYNIPVLDTDFSEPTANCVTALQLTCPNLQVLYTINGTPTTGTPANLNPNETATVTYTVSIFGAPVHCAATGSYTVSCTTNSCSTPTLVSGISGDRCEDDDLGISAEVNLNNDLNLSVVWILNGDTVGNIPVLNTTLADPERCVGDTTFQLNAIVTCGLDNSPTIINAGLITVYTIPQINLDFNRGFGNCVTGLAPVCDNLEFSYTVNGDPIVGFPDNLEMGDDPVVIGYTASYIGAPAGCSSSGSYTVECGMPTCDNANLIQGISGDLCADDNAEVSAAINLIGGINTTSTVAWQLNGQTVSGQTGTTFNATLAAPSSCSSITYQLTAIVTCDLDNSAQTIPAGSVSIYAQPTLGTDFTEPTANCILPLNINCAETVVNYTVNGAPVNELPANLNPGDANITVGYTIGLTNAPSNCVTTGSYAVMCPADTTCGTPQLTTGIDGSRCASDDLSISAAVDIIGAFGTNSTVEWFLNDTTTGVTGLTYTANLSTLPTSCSSLNYHLQAVVSCDRDTVATTIDAGTLSIFALPALGTDFTEPAMCETSLQDVCSNTAVSYTVNGVAIDGEPTNVNHQDSIGYSITVSGALTGCSTMGSYLIDCDTLLTICPSIALPNLQEDTIMACDGDNLDLVVQLVDSNDDRIISWSNGAVGDTISTGVLTANNSCGVTTVTFTAVLPTANNCPADSIVYTILIFPTINASNTALLTSADNCIARVTSCSDFSVSYSVNDGPTQTGSLYAAMAGETATVDFTIINNALVCGDTLTLQANLNCAASPMFGTIGDFVWEDTNGNGIFDTGEQALANITVNLLDAEGVIIDIVTTNANGAYTFNNVAPGMYAVSIIVPDGSEGTTPTMVEVTVVAGDQITTVDFGIRSIQPMNMGSISGFIWNDENCNGSLDEGEGPIAGVSITLFNASGIAIDATTTATDGTYQFNNLAGGSYSVIATPPNGFTGTLPTNRTITLTNNQQLTGINFAFKDNTAAAASISGFIWNDENCNGSLDEGEGPIAGVSVTLFNASGIAIDATTTATDGTYQFNNLAGGSYSVIATPPNGFTGTLPTNRAITLTNNQQLSGINFAFKDNTAAAASISGFIWNDENCNGNLDEGEGPIAGVSVTLFNDSGMAIGATTTATDGTYQFNNLAEGSYSVIAATPNGFTGTLPTNRAVTLTNNQQLAGINFAFKDNTATGTISGTAWNDEDGDGIFDANEMGLGGIAIILIDTDGNVVGSLFTNPNGTYTFVDIDAGEYTVAVGTTTIPTGFEPTTSVSFVVTVVGGQTIGNVNFGFQTQQAVCAAEAGTFPTTPSRYCANTAVGVSALGFNSSADYTQLYFLTQGSNNLIVASSTTGNFGVLATGSYAIYALNYQTANAPAIPTVGQSLNNIFTSTDACFDLMLSERVNFSVLAPIQIVVDPFCIDGNNTGYFATLTISGGLPTQLGTGSYIVNVSATPVIYDASIGAAVTTVGPFSNNSVQNIQVISDGNGCTSNTTVGPFICEGMTNSCTPVPGTLPTTTEFVCTGGLSNITASGLQIDPMDNEIAVYAVHPNPVLSSSLDILATNTIGVFNVTDILFGQRNTQYYVSTIVGPDVDNDGVPDLGDPCTAISANATPLVFLNPIIIVTNPDCNRTINQTNIFINVRGGLPEFDSNQRYTLSGSVNTSIRLNEVIQIGPFVPGDTYAINATDAVNCNAGISDVVLSCITVAVDLLDFSGEVLALGNELQWITASEVNNDYFIIERSVDGLNFDAIGQVDGAGTRATLTSYNFLDKTAVNGINYYRLVQVDVDGKTETFAPITLVRGETHAQFLQVSPIPVQATLQVQFGSVANLPTTIEIYDLAGKLVHQQQVVSQAGLTVQMIEVQDLSAGIYFLSIENEAQTQTTRFIKAN